MVLPLDPVLNVSKARSIGMTRMLYMMSTAMKPSHAFLIVFLGKTSQRSVGGGPSGYGK